MSIEVNRQYIGARYVPKFFENPNTADSTWLEGVGYEPLTIVTYAGNSYTSKKPVPAGIGSPNLNGGYWVNTGNFNAQVETIRNELVEVERDLNAEMDELREDIAGIYPVKPANVAPKQYILLADSFGNPSTIGGDTWIQRFENLAGVVEGTTAFSSFSGSGGFVNEGSNGTYLSMLTTITESGNIPDRNMITDIVIQTAGNDWEKTAEQIRTALIAFMQYAHRNYPYAKIHVAVTCKFNTVSTQSSVPIKRVIIPLLSSSSYANGYHYITNSEYIMLTLAVSDGIHPTAYSSEILAGYLYSGVIGGSVEITQHEVMPITDTLTGMNGFGDMSKDIHNNCISIYNGHPIVNVGAPITLFNSTATPITGYSFFNGLKVGAVSTDYIRPLSAPTGNIFLQLHSTGGEMYNVPATIGFNYNSSTGKVDILLTTSFFKADKSAVSFDKIEMSKFNLTGITEWLM